MLVPVSGYARVKNLVSGIEQTAADGLDHAFECLHAAIQTSGEHGVLAVSVAGASVCNCRVVGGASLSNALGSS